MSEYYFTIRITPDNVLNAALKAQRRERRLLKYQKRLPIDYRNADVLERAREHIKAADWAGKRTSSFCNHEFLAQSIKGKGKSIDVPFYYFKV